MSIDIPVFRMVNDPAVEKALREAAARVITSGRFVLGPEGEAFEAEFAAYCGAGECVAVANGTDAIELALRGVGVRSGDSVITVANAGNFASTALAAIGARPLYVDVDEDSLTLSPSALTTQLDGVRAIVVTHLYGRLAAIEQVVEIAAARGIPVVEDCAQAHGSMRQERRAGTFGRIGCFSFYPTKNLGALGDGGAIVTSDRELAKTIRALRQYGWTTKYKAAFSGGRNSRLDEIQAAFLRIKLRVLDDANLQRIAIAQRYRDAFANLPLKMLHWTDGEYVAHAFPVRVEQRDEFRAYLTHAGIGTDIHFPIPDYRQPMAGYDDKRATLPVTEMACASVTTLPCFPGLSSEEVDRVIVAVRQFFGVSR
jgi:dTDP-4-amino-4,6-dideoxygalactose transaminase